MSRDIAAEIKKQVTENQVVLYMKGTKDAPMCGFSSAVVEVLNELGTEFVDVNVLADGELREGIKRYSDWPTLPQLYIGGEFVGGCDIVREMHTRGELSPLLAKPAA